MPKGADEETLNVIKQCICEEFNIMVQRKDSDIIVPSGETLLLEDDKVIMLKVDRALDFSSVDESDKE